MTRNIGWLVLGTLAIASCTAILGGVPTTGGTGGGAAGGPSTSRGAGAGGAGGTPSSAGGNGGIGGGGGAPPCQPPGATCGSAEACCKPLACGSEGTCVNSTSIASTGSGSAPCKTCNDALKGQLDGLCKVSSDKLTALKNCACGQFCGSFCTPLCNGQGGADMECQSCADGPCEQQLDDCTGDKGCNTCSQMVDSGDIDPSDACPGDAEVDFNALFACVCMGGMVCNGCQGFCAGMGFSSSCKQCVQSQTSGCSMPYQTCEHG